MTEISSPVRAPSLLSPRTANYVAALIREGDNFDYYKWLQGVREEEAQAKQVPATFTSGEITAAEIDHPIGTSDCRSASPNSGPAPMTRAAPLPKSATRSHHEPGSKTPKARVRRRLEKIRDAWDDFQASRARDAVYGYLDAVFAIVEHYKVRRRTKRLLRHAFKFADLPFDNNADPFTAVIRCTCDDDVDSKTISKWARALRYVARCKEPPDAAEDVYEESRWGQCVCRSVRKISWTLQAMRGAGSRQPVCQVLRWRRSALGDKRRGRGGPS